jgi:FkbM family methyltransferase
MSHLLNTLGQILHSDSVPPVQGLLRHTRWQIRRLFGRFPCELPIAGSQLHVERPGGVAALVNAMGEYDYNNMELLRLVLSRVRGTFFDVGANIGVYTLIGSESQNTQVVSIEPHPGTFALLKLNVELNSRSNVLCLNLALSSEPGQVRLSDYQESAINRVVTPGDGESRTLSVTAQRFDQLCSDLDLDPDFIKIDVEGHEETLLQGFGNRLGEAKLICIERGETPDLRGLLQSAGYSGPWYCQFKKRRLSKRKQARPEDPIYVGQSFLRDLREMNFVIG